MCDLPCRENGVTFISCSTHNPRPTAPRPQPRTDLNYPLNTKQLKIGGCLVYRVYPARPTTLEGYWDDC